MENKYISVVDSFRLLSEVKKLFVYIDKYVYTNFPKDRKHLKILLLIISQLVQLISAKIMSILTLKIFVFILKLSANKI